MRLPIRKRASAAPPREGIDDQGDQRAIAQTEQGGLADFDPCLGPRTLDAGLVGTICHKRIEQHAAASFRFAVGAAPVRNSAIERP
jgi:hypothetical protein